MKHLSEGEWVDIQKCLDRSVATSGGEWITPTGVVDLETSSEVMHDVWSAVVGDGFHVSHHLLVPSTHKDCKAFMLLSVKLGMLGIHCG